MRPQPLPGVAGRGPGGRPRPRSGRPRRARRGRAGPARRAVPVGPGVGQHADPAGPTHQPEGVEQRGRSSGRRTPGRPGRAAGRRPRRGRRRATGDQGVGDVRATGRRGTRRRPPRRPRHRGRSRVARSRRHARRRSPRPSTTASRLAAPAGGYVGSGQVDEQVARRRGRRGSCSSMPSTSAGACGREDGLDRLVPAGRVSWSVRPSTSRPAAAASSHERGGVTVPSERSVWVCRSIASG